ncbi:LPXTG cell wall anchor domain-containing protein [Streptomyces indicus]|uniref:LPXTG-motif cell wall anchor domain-containing protein n=1 Tax=Streptomyces indicus TaxID=417292 RepID=A0A1G9I1L7_9ACTN|nr:LPXTG cell wall anchor domain-containing protein [Streptomyces indicus]SDL19121.1 LPXTG-motif cell wall anchor domain-containing protein [Streptomyces indicus]
MSYQKSAAALLAAALAGSAVLLAAPAAHATVVDVNYDCKTPIGPKSAVSPVDIKAEKSGSGYKLTVTFNKGVSSSPVALPKGVMKPSIDIKLGGAESGTVKATAGGNPADIPANSPIKIHPMTATYTPKGSGKVTFSAGTLTISAMQTTTTCTPKNNPKPSLELDVKGSGGGAGSATDGGTGGDAAAAPDGGSELPQTGPEDSALALGTLGGTVLLVGAGGVLWLTRRNQAVRR